MASVTISLRTDSDLKKQAEEEALYKAQMARLEAERAKAKYNNIEIIEINTIK